MDKRYSLKDIIKWLTAAAVIGAAIYFIPLLLPHNAPATEPETTEEAELTEKSDMNDPDYWEIDGPTVGDDETRAYNCIYTNGGDLLEAGLYVKAVHDLLPEWINFQNQHSEYMDYNVLTYVEDSFHDYPETQVFQLTLEGSDEVLNATYNKNSMKLTYGR